MTHADERIDVYCGGHDRRGRPLGGSFLWAENEVDDERDPLEVETAADADAVDVWITLDLAGGTLDGFREGGGAESEDEDKEKVWLRKMMEDGHRGS